MSPLLGCCILQKKRVTALPDEENLAPNTIQGCWKLWENLWTWPGREERALGFPGEGLTLLGKVQEQQEGPPGQGTWGTKAAQRVG